MPVNKNYQKIGGSKRSSKSSSKNRNRLLKDNMSFRNIIIILIVVVLIAVVIGLSVGFGVKRSDFMDLKGNEGFQDADKTETSDGESKVVLFFATWCGHCKAMKGDWEKMKSEMNGMKTSSGNSLSFVEVDCSSKDSPPPEMSKYDVGGFPTIKGFSNGEEKDEYSGDRSLSSMKDYAMSL